MEARAGARVLSVALAIALFGQAPQPVGDQRLRALSMRYFAELWETDPIRATGVGVHDYDGKLPDFSAAAFAARASSIRHYLGDLAAIDPNSLGAEGSYDRRIFEANLQTSLISLQTLAAWRHDPSYYTSRLANAAYGLLARDFAPLRSREQSLLDRERLMPAALDTARANIEGVDPVTADLARRSIAGTIDFFASAVPAAVEPAAPPAFVAQFKVANDAVVAALHGYDEAMEAGPFAHPIGTYAIGPALYEKLLALQELEPIPLATYERLGQSALRQTEAEFVSTAARIDPKSSPREVAAALGTVHPSPADLLKAAANDIAALRAFVIARKILTLPADDDVQVVPTPQFSRQTTFASINVTGPLEKTASVAYFEITPAEADWSPERREEHLAFFNDYALPLISVHEVMPGHYVNFALDRHEQLSPIRRLLPSKTFAEGWAHYAEQMMVDEGWGQGDPHVRLAQLQLALQRECRYLVGLREHTEGMTVAEATRFFEEHAFMGEEPARREALRGTQDPLYGYYTLGKLELLKLRDDFKKAAGSEYSLEAFHDQLLDHGDPPIAIARKIVLGADDDGKLL